MTEINGYKIINELSPEHAAKILVSQLINIINNNKKEKGECVLAVSGGSSILKIYDALKANSSIQKTFWKDVIVVWVDERHVPQTNENSNFGNAYHYYWKEVVNAELIPVLYDSDIKNSVNNYTAKLAEKNILKGGIDVTLLGMGNDAHTASLFPSAEALTECDEQIVSVKLQEILNERVTMTYSLLNSSKQIILYTYGAEKGAIFNKALLSGNKNYYPILGIEKSNMVIYTDQFFYKELSSRMVPDFINVK